MKRFNFRKPARIQSRKLWKSDEYGNNWPELSEKVKKRDNYTCVKCGYTKGQEPHRNLEADHILPITKGGKTVMYNLRTLCSICHKKRTNIGKRV